MIKKLRLFSTLLLLAVASMAWGEQFTYDFSTGGTFNSGDKPTCTWVTDYFTILQEQNTSTSKVANYTTAPRWYQNHHVTFTPADDITITSIVINCSTNNNGQEITASTGSVSASGNNSTWTGTITSSTPLVLTMGKQCRPTSLVVTYTSGGSTTETCATPTFSPAAGTYTSAQDVTLSCATEGSTIYYTTDGTNPTDGSTKYTAPFNVATTTTIKAIAVKGGMDNSPVASATYAILGHAGTEADPYTVADARAAIDANTGITGVYVTGIVSEIVAAFNSEYGNISFNISADGETTSDQLESFRCFKGPNKEKFTSADCVLKGDEVVLYGNLTKFNSTYELAEGNYVVSLIRTDTKPAINASDVNIGSNAASVSIDYTITNPVDGVNPKATLQDGIDWISNVTVDVINKKITFDVTENDGTEDRSATITLSYEGAENKIVTVTQKHHVADYAELPFEWEGGSSSDFTDLAGVTTDGLGSDYAAGNAPYLIKLDNTGDYIMVKTDSRPGKVTINVKMLGGANTSSITIQGSSDGSEFSDVEELEIAGTQNSELTLETSNDFAENDRFVKLVFTKGSNVGVGAITIAKYTTSASITVAKTEVLLTAAESEGTIGVTYKNLADVPEVAFFAADGTTEAEYSWLVAEIDGNNISYMVEANEGEARTAYMKVYGLDAEANDIYSDLITITQAAAVTPGTGDSYQLFSGDLVEGDYIIYYDGKAMNTTVTSDRLQYEEVTPTGNVITTENAAIVWHIAKSGDYWTIYNADADAYAASTGAKNKAQMLEDGTDDKALWTVSGTETYDFVNKKNTANSVNAYLRNHGTYGFACYASTTGGALSLYKKVEEAPQPEIITVSVNALATDGNKYYSTLYYSDKNLKIPAGVTASGVSVDGKSLVMGPELAEDDVIAKGNAVLLTADADGDYEFTVVADTEVDANISWDANLLRGNDEKATTEGGNVYYQLSLNATHDANSIGFYWGAENGGAFTNKAHRAYLAVKTEQAGGAKGFAFNDMATGIKSIAADTENGNAIIYNLAGQRVSNAQKGIYIVNGKKVVIR